MRDDYKLLDKITNYFPPEEAQKGSIIPIIFALAISGLAFYYVSQVYTHQGNLNNMSFWGSIFVANYLLILLVIVAFWVKVNLVNTLWILLALSPITIYVMILSEFASSARQLTLHSSLRLLSCSFFGLARSGCCVCFIGAYHTAL